MLNGKAVKILIIDDDEDDYFIMVDYINKIEGTEFIIDWCTNAKDAIGQFKNGQYDIYFVDYRLGAQNGLELVKEAIQLPCESPIILLTGNGNKALDVESMQSGATDYLVKSELSSEKLERCIRYSLDRTASLKSLKESEIKYRNLFAGSKDALFIADNNLFFKEVNNSAVSLFKQDNTLLQNMQLYNFIDDETIKNKISNYLLHHKEINDLEIIITNIENEKKNCLLSILIENESSGQQLIHGIVQDITNIKKAEKANVHAEKLAANERLVRVLAHEIRNPLNNIKLSADHLDIITDKAEQPRAMIGIIQRNSLRINQLITELLDSTKTLELEFERYSLQEILEEGLAITMDRITLQQIKLYKTFPDNALYILADKKKLQIGFSNLIINAVEAMDAGQGELQIHLTEAETVYSVTIKDNGKGIPEEQMSKLFEPFFTMKKNGMGLGLSAAYGIFKSHNAVVSVESIEHCGTTFRIEFNKIIEQP